MASWGGRLPPSASRPSTWISLDAVDDGLRLPGIELGGLAGAEPSLGIVQAVVGALAETLADSSVCPDLVALEGTLGPRIGRSRCGKRGRTPAPGEPPRSGVGLSDGFLRGSSFDAWFSTKSSNFRSEMRRLRRQFAAAGGAMGLSTLNTRRSDVDIFVRLTAPAGRSAAARASSGSARVCPLCSTTSDRRSSTGGALPPAPVRGRRRADLGSALLGRRRPCAVHKRRMGRAVCESSSRRCSASSP